MLINRDRETLFRFVLADDVFVEKRAYFLRFGKRRPSRRSLSTLVVIDDLVADVYAFVANIDARAGDQLFDVILRLAAKRAAEEFFRTAEICHKQLSVSSYQSDPFFIDRDNPFNILPISAVFSSSD
jgi:hypothetical protein